MDTLPPLVTVIVPACTAAVQTDESSVYVPVPQRRPVVPLAGQTNRKREPLCPRKRTAVAAQSLPASAGPTPMARAGTAGTLTPTTRQMVMATDERILMCVMETYID